jgi:hypothetical protein
MAECVIAPCARLARFKRFMHGGRVRPGGLESVALSIHSMPRWVKPSSKYRDSFVTLVSLYCKCVKACFSGENLATNGKRTSHVRAVVRFGCGAWPFCVFVFPFDSLRHCLLRLTAWWKSGCQLQRQEVERRNRKQ